ncbi:MAG: hypothetical protein R3288_10870, partial [Woeseiaceae bacterium]|nr:hypothetical protein [Woeseiaceae bacterium]
QRGASLVFTWQAGVRTEFVARGATVRRDDGAASRSDYYGAGLGINYRLGASTELSLSYDYAEEQPTSDTSTSEDYVSNVASLYVTYTF